MRARASRVLARIILAAAVVSAGALGAGQATAGQGDEDLTVCGWINGGWLSAATPTYGQPCAWSPARLSGTGDLLEDESPYTGLYGGELVSYSRWAGYGVACYSDHTATDGRGWFYVMSCEGDR